jgi:NADH-quinone oxidoreductase subunit L
MNPQWMQVALVTILALPTLAVLLLALPSWFGARMSERGVVAVLSVAFTGALAACAVLSIAMAISGTTSVESPVGAWFQVGHHHFQWRLVGDRLSIPFAAFSAMLVGLIGAFSRRYLHREPGFFRFYLLLALFGAGVELVVLAGTLDLVFFGWELVGLSSALLIGFFHERPKPVEHGLRAFLTYRTCDIGLLGAAVWLHHSTGGAVLVPGDPWAGLGVPAGAGSAVLVGLLLLWAAMGKSAQVPFCGWLPRAMEGPTPSSAIFYGAISVHLGPYLLLRAAPLLEREPFVAGAVVTVGVLTALHGTFVGRVQTDIKSALAYASMTQVGLILVEIGLGLRFLALVHIVGHAAVRSLQVLRSPSLLHDHHHLEQAMGRALPRTGRHLERLVPRAVQPWLYRLALERGYFDSLLVDYAVGGFRRLARVLDRADRALTRRLAGAPRGEASERGGES